MLVLNLVRVRGLGLYGFQQKYEMNIGADSQCSVIEMLLETLFILFPISFA